MAQLSPERLFQLLSTEWNGTRKRGAALRDMESFLQDFAATIRTRFDTLVLTEKLQSLFMVSDKQACLCTDVVVNKVLFKAVKGAVFEPLGDGNFDMICTKFFDRISKKPNWLGYPPLKDIFSSTLRKNPNINCHGIALKDILHRLLKHNVVQIRHHKLPRKNSMNVNMTPKVLTNHFVAYVNSLGATRPTNRRALQAAYDNFLANGPPDFENVPFAAIVRCMKLKRIIKFSPGAGNITYLQQKRLATDQYFGRWQPPKSDATEPDTQLSNEQHVNENRKKSQSSRMANAIGKDALSKLAKDAHGISITSDLDNEESREFGIIDIGSHMQGERVMAKLTISYAACEGGEKSITLAGCKLLDNSNEVFTIGDRYNIHQGKKILELKDGSSYQITVYYKSKHIGKHKCPLELQFSLGSEPIVFSIFRFIIGETKTSEIDELLPEVPYCPLKPRQIARDPQTEIVRGIPPVGLSNTPVQNKLKDYKIPSGIRYNVNSGNGQVSGAVKKDLEEKISGPDIYQKKFHTLLYLEELQMEVDIRQFDMENAELKRAGNLLSLEVPGLAEGKPSLIIGDQAYVRVESSDGQQQIKYDRKEYQGYIHVVERDRILLKFNPSFHNSFVNRQRHRVRFSFNRTTIRLQHRAIDIACNLISQRRFPSLLNPQGSQIKPLLTEREVDGISCSDRKIENNAEQLTAVKNIVAGSSRPFPYIIFGPPGTGKTVTCVEAMKQILKLSRNSRILACTPSNSAADLILQRLIKGCPIPSRSIFRFNAFSRSLNTLPDDFNIEDFCKIENGAFAMPTMEEIGSYRVIICTMVNAGRLVSMGLPMDHFTHVFLDESGQAVEPESLIPLAGLISPENEFGGQVVFAGDPKQLGPVIHSPIAIEHGLQVSLLERVMEVAEIYQRHEDDTGDDDSADESSDESSSLGSDSDDEFQDDIIGRMNALDRNSDTGDDDDDDDDDVGIETGRFNKKYITKLVRNYRSHPDILRQPNRLFYSNELIPSADNFKVTSLCQWSELPTKDFPIIFHGVEGEDAREGSSPSFFNRHEAVEVVKYVRALLDHKSLGVTPNEIGVISPYRKQVSKIRQLLKKDGARPRIEELKVGSVEEFQGQERRIIIISTVRSNREYLKMDSKFRLGFLKNPKRFNVAITRAQALLIVVGNPFILAEDEHWKVLLNYCIKRGGYRGCKYDDDVINDLSAKLSNMMNGL